MANYVIGRTVPIFLSLEDWLDNDGNNLPVKIELTRNSGSSWETIVSATNNNTIYNWTVTEPSATGAYFKYSDPDVSAVYVNSNPFNINVSGSSSSTYFYSLINGQLVTIVEYGQSAGGMINYIDSDNNLKIGINTGNYSVSAV